MNIRPFLLLCLMTVLFPVSAWSQISARKIAPIEVGYVEPSSLSISGDGRFITLLSLPGEKGSDCIVIDRRTHKTNLLPGSSRAEPLCFSHDGKQLWIWGLHLDEPLPGLRVKPSDHEFLALYDLRRKRYTRYLQLPDSDDGVVGASVLSRDGRALIYSTEYGWVIGISTRTGRQLWKSRVQDKGDVPVSVELSSDGSRFLRIDDEEDGSGQSAQVVSTRTGRVLSTLQLKFASSEGLRSAFESSKFAPRGSMVALFQQDTQQWAFFDSRTGKLKWKMGGPSRVSEGDLKWQWSPNARFVGVFGPKGFEVRDAQNGRTKRVCPQLQGEALTFSPDGSRVYALTDNDTGFGLGTVLWQWRLFPTSRQRRTDARFMTRLRRREDRFARDPRHINESLIQAASQADAARVDFLLNWGARIDTTDRRGGTLLENAINVHEGADYVQRSRATVKLLVARGANINARGGSVLAGAASGDFALTQFLLQHGARVNGDASAYGTPTALFAATQFGQFDSAKLLLEHGAQVDARDEDRCTPLMQAIQHNGSVGNPHSDSKKLVALVNLLLDHGADVNARRKEGEISLGETVLAQATRWDNDPPLIQLLLERGAHPNEPDQSGNTALMNVVAGYEPRADFPDPQGEKNVISIIHLLTSHGADANARNKEGQTVLSLAKSPAIKAALQTAGAKP